MSRILEALKGAERVRDPEVTPVSGRSDAIQTSDRRRSRRWTLDIPVYVYGYGTGTEPFHEEAHTLNVNANGALLLLSVPVQEGQMLLLTNELTQREQNCRVVFLGTQHTRTVETGVAFLGSNPDFWRMHLPADD